MGKKKVKGVMGKKELDEVGVEVSVLGGQGESVHVLDDDIFKRDLMDLRDVPPGNRDEVALCTKSSIRFYSGSKSMRADYAHQQSHHHKTTQTVRVKMISNAPPPPPLQKTGTSPTDTSINASYISNLTEPSLYPRHLPQTTSDDDSTIESVGEIKMKTVEVIGKGDFLLNFEERRGGDDDTVGRYVN